jgi:predicted SAM-dependent methyltransferase
MEREVTVADRLKLNIGCGAYYKDGWVNIDASSKVKSDLLAEVPPLPYPDNSVDEIYAGHFLEHLWPVDADAFLVECLRVLKPFSRIGVVVPDMGVLFREYVKGNPEFQMETLSHVFIYSTYQESLHRWCYEESTLADRLRKNGLHVVGPIDRFNDPRLAAGAWWQCGVDAIKMGEFA